MTLNSDIPSMTGVWLATEYQNARQAFDFNDEQLASLATAGVDASFAPPPLKDTLRQEIEDWLAAA